MTAAGRRRLSCCRRARSAWAWATVLWVAGAEDGCLDEAVAAKGLLLRPDRLTCRGLRVLPVKEGNMAAVNGS